MNLRYIDWIWHVRGSLALAPGQTRDDAFDRLDPLFHQVGTSHERTSDTLVFRKKDQASQDQMSIFDGGVLRFENADAGPVLRYDLISRALLFCFFMPLLFLGIAQLTIYTGDRQKASAEAAEKAEKAAGKHKPEVEKALVPLNPIDKFLGAPAPEKAKKDDPDKPKGRKKKPSPTSAYVFAAIFATLYVVGRVLEDWLVKRLLIKHLPGSGPVKSMARQGLRQPVG